MFYKVKKEDCGKGIKSRYTIGQIIDDSEIEKLKNNFNKYFYTIYNDRKETKIEYFNIALFGAKEFIYSILLEKTLKHSK